MKTACMAFVMCLAATATGCVSATIAQSGRKLDRYENRADVRTALGSPVARSDSSEQAFEDYRFRGKISDNGSAQMVGTLGALTLGLSEIVYIPTMLADLPRQMRQVHLVRYFYDHNGEVTRFEEQDPPIVADQSDERAKR